MGARLWVGTLAVVAVVCAVLTAETMRATGAQYLALGILAGCAAIAHVFPIHSIFDGASIRLTNVFLMAAAIVLPPGLLCLMPVLSITPDTWMRRRSPGALTRWLFNVSQSTLAALLTGSVIQRFSYPQVHDGWYLLGLAAGALVMTLAQNLTVGIVIALNSRIPLLRTDAFTVPHLQSIVLVNTLGSVVGGLWLVKPALLVLALPLVVLAYFLSRSAHLAHLAHTDAKTGLHNYRHFESLLAEELTRTHRTGRPLALFFADLDYLRKVNNTYGHLAGDRVLHEVATILTRTLRKSDVIARFGGEEFIALLPGTDAEEATYLAEKVREAVAGHAFTIEEGRAIGCTISIGVAACPEDAADVAGLIKQADMAMYRAKQTRNAVARVRALPPVPRVPQPHKGAAAGTESGAPSAPSRFVPLALWATGLSGAVAVLWSIYRVTEASTWLKLVPFLVLAAVAEFVKIRIYEGRQDEINVSFSVAVTMAATTFLPHGGPIVGLAGALTHVLFIRRPRALKKALFNLACPALSAGVAAAIYLAFSGGAGAFTGWHLVGATLAMTVFHVTNFGLVSLMVSLHTGRTLAAVLRASSWYSPTKLFLGLTGAFLPGVYSHTGLTGVVMFVVPLLVLRYTLTTYARQSEQTIAALQAAKNEAEAAHLEKEETLHKLIETIANIVDARDNAVAGHSKQVSTYAVALGRSLGLAPRDLALVQTAGLLHDMGKVSIPEAILHKPERLTPEEYEIVKEHTRVGERILAEVGPLTEVARMVGEHHERYDGGGYPRGKAGAEISLGGRIVAVADCLDSILSDRPYSKGRSLAWALAEIDRCAGTQFDPLVVEALHRVVQEEGAEFFVKSNPRRDAQKEASA
jgi:diguanylate cyclase (GGDEF)-like protein/putative nucleotidyltransferase with HDIG domain